MALARVRRRNGPNCPASADWVPPSHSLNNGDSDRMAAPQGRRLSASDTAQGRVRSGNLNHDSSEGLAALHLPGRTVPAPPRPRVSRRRRNTEDTGGGGIRRTPAAAEYGGYRRRRNTCAHASRSRYSARMRRERGNALAARAARAMRAAEHRARP
jgi:hypothetical protein